MSPDLSLLAQDPSTQPLIQFADLTYAGAFRLPRAAINNDNFSNGGEPFTYNPANDTIYAGTRAGRVAEITIPKLINSANVENLLFSSYLQGFRDPMEGNIWQVASDGASIEGLLVQDGKMYGSAAMYYDANNVQRVSHYARSTDLSASSFVGMVPVWQSDKMGFVAGFMSTVPPEWQSRLGGTAITGQCCTTIAWKTSWGPAAFAWNPSDIGSKSLVPATPLLYYSNEHPTLGHWSTTGSSYGQSTRMEAVVVIAGTRTVLFFGSNGTGTACYGNGTSDKSLDRTLGADGTMWCYDPTSTDKGQHAYPYQYQIWAYDLNDLAAVRAGTKQPWDVMPYGVWPFELPVKEMHARLGGVAYDAKRQMLYLSQMYADMDGYANRALVHALKINRAPASITTPVDSTGPSPSGTGSVSKVTLSRSVNSPQPLGTTINWTATPVGGITPYQYKWSVYDGATWTSSQWAASNTFAWTPAKASEWYRVVVRVRSYGAVSDLEEASFEEWYTILPAGTAPPPATTPPPPPPSTTTPPPTSTARTTSVSLTADQTAPQRPGTTINWTATPSGGVAPHQYQWWTSNGSSWTQATGWQASNKFVWTPAIVSEYNRVAVWVRSAGATGTYEANREEYFAISSSAPAPAVVQPAPAPPPPTTTTPTARVSSVVLASDRPAPQRPGTTINFTAVPAGGVSPHQYQWWTNTGNGWVQATGWSSANAFSWTPTTASVYHRVAVWVRSAGATGTYEATAETYYVISTSAPVSEAPPPTTTPVVPNAPATAVKITANLAQPQPVGTTITWTATVTGGVAPYQYQWWTFDGTKWTSSPWTSSNIFAWRSTVSSAYARVAVYVRSAWNTGAQETSGEAFFAIK